MFQYHTLIFTGRWTGWTSREVQKVTGDRYFYLGMLNRDRTVVEAIKKLCREQSNCNAWEVYLQIKVDTSHLAASGQFPREFPDPNDTTFEYLSLEDVRRHINSVLKRSEQHYSKFIPAGIKRVPGTTMIVYEPVIVHREERVMNCKQCGKPVDKSIEGELVCESCWSRGQMSAQERKDNDEIAYWSTHCNETSCGKLLRTALEKETLFCKYHQCEEDL